LQEDTGLPHFYHCFAYFDFALDCFYWTSAWIDKLLVLDAVRMEFSIVNNKPSDKQSRGNPHVAVGEEGTPLMLFISDHNEDVSGDHLHITKVNASESSDQWKLENIIPVPRQYRYFLMAFQKKIICGYILGRNMHSENILHWMSGLLNFRRSVR
jgi:hypothetical protein